MKMNKALNILIVLLIFVLGCIFGIDYYNNVQKSKQAAIAEQEAGRNNIPTDENSINIVTDVEFEQEFSENDIFLSFENFLKDCNRTSHYIGETVVDYRFLRPLTSGSNEVYLLNFKMRAETEAAQVNVSFGTEHVYYLTTQWRDYYMPCTKGVVDFIKWELLTPFQKVYLSDVKVIRYNPLETDFNKIKNGTFSVFDMESHLISENEGIGTGRTMDVVGDGEYMYSVGGGKLTVSHIGEDKPVIVSVVEGIGNARHIELRDENTLGIASRENGVYIVNISDKANPFIESYYDSLELANDIAFTGNYMIVSGRYFGVEIVDITDLKKPLYITRITNGKECFRCTIDGNYLFVSCWASSEVEIYDISTINNPVLVSTVSVDGRCAEAFVEGSVLYVASGYNHVNAAEVGDPGYGTGNGVAIYDITDIKHPKWCSTIKAEGMLYGNGYDDWSVKVTDGYLYFTNSFGGMYIYDVSNHKSPKAISHVAVEILPDSENFVNFSKNPNHVYPCDITERIYSPSMGVYVDDGRVFVACEYTDVYEFEFDKAKYVKPTHKENTSVLASENEVTSEEYQILLGEYDVYAVEKLNSCYVVATSEGLLLTDKNFRVLGKTLTDMPVKDVELTSDGYIITAEITGVGVYHIEDNSLIKTAFVNSEMNNCSVSSIGVTGDGNFAIIQASWQKFEAVDLRDKFNPMIVDTVINKNGKEVDIKYAVNLGNMYYRNIVTGTVDGKVGIGGTNIFALFESTGDKLKISNSYTNVFASETNGTVALDNGQLLSVYNNGYMIYNPLNVSETDLKNSTRYYVSNTRLKGKAAFSKNTLVLSNHPTGEIQIIDISEPKNPSLLNLYKFKESVGVALVEEDFILVPVRHGGIVKISL